METVLSQRRSIQIVRSKMPMIEEGVVGTSGSSVSQANRAHGSLDFLGKLRGGDSTVTLPRVMARTGAVTFSFSFLLFFLFPFSFDESLESLYKQLAATVGHSLRPHPYDFGKETDNFSKCQSIQ